MNKDWRLSPLVLPKEMVLIFTKSKKKEEEKKLETCAGLFPMQPKYTNSELN